jgi:hypothetical protein
MALLRVLGQAGALGTAGIKDRNHLRERYLAPVLAAGLIKPTLLDLPIKTTPLDSSYQ